MKIPVSKQAEFLEKAWQAQREEYTRIIQSNIKGLLQQKVYHLGSYARVDVVSSCLTVLFPSNRSPRLGMHFQAYILAQDVPISLEHEVWNSSLGAFILNSKHILTNSEIQVAFRKSSGDSSLGLIGFLGETSKFRKTLADLHAIGKSPRILLGPKPPPLQYLMNLKTFIKNNPSDSTINLNLKYGLESWHPTPLPEGGDHPSLILQELKSTDELIVQGPPGTGKSYLMAEVCSMAVAMGQSVCVVALTNKALMEIVEKPGIEKHLDEGNVSKTNLQYNETKSQPNLRSASDLLPAKGTILLATYYKFSSWLTKQATPVAVYDLLIIEEASQSFLATIAAFRKLAHKVIIVGDPMQLPPIYDEKLARRTYLGMDRFARGLEYYAANSGVRSFLLNRSHRFGPAAAKQTSEFYDGRLKSVKDRNPEALTCPQFQALMPKDGASVLHGMPINGEGDTPAMAIRQCVNIVLDLKKFNAGIEIAVLAPYIATVTRLQDELAKKLDDFTNLTVETIDSVQGLTVDVTIFLIPLKRVSFALEPNRFNVATSRARRGTIIITDPNWDYFVGIDQRVIRFLQRVPKV